MNRDLTNKNMAYRENALINPSNCKYLLIYN